MAVSEEISLDELVVRLERSSRELLDDVQARVMGPATERLEAKVRENIEARMEMRSRQLLTSVRSELDRDGDTLRGIVSAGGSFGGLEVRYARLQELGGTIRPVNASLLAIPVDAGLTGPGIPRYTSPRQMPFAAFRPVSGRPKLRYVVYDARNNDVYFLLVTETEVRGKYFMRDALAEVYANLAAELADVAAAGVVGDA